MSNSEEQWGHIGSTSSLASRLIIQQLLVNKEQDDLHKQTFIKHSTTYKSSGQRCPRGLKSTPALFPRDIVGRANEPEHIGDFSGFGEFFLVFGVHGGEVGTEEVLKIFTCRFSPLLFRIEETA
ncbi:MAG: hypothetical protein ACYTEQ_30615, partial [Planctomycetota bacterium]